jgi:DNA-binding transcriptional regulator YiaG
MIKQQNIQRLHYTACGLDNIFILTELGDNKNYSIPNLDDLHDCIAINLVLQKQKLSGKEFRFVRKELKFTQKDIANNFGVDVQTVGRWEKEETEGGAYNLADRLIRLIYLSRKERANEAEKLFKHLSELDVQCQNDWMFEINKSSWRFSYKKIA